MTDDYDRFEKMNVSSGTGSPDLSETKSRELKTVVCVCVCVCVCVGRGGRIGQCNVTYRMHVALHCGCCIPTAECLDSFAVGIARLAHTAGESILCHE